MNHDSFTPSAINIASLFLSLNSQSSAMGSSKISSSFLFVFSALIIMGAEHGVNASNKGDASQKMFVFGDSYADTGNLGKLDRTLTRCWYEPYGMTFPRRPSGRFSDGKVLPDFIASFIGIRSPVPYKLRRRVSPGLLRAGMNFAVAGAGVFDLGNLQRNLSAQIDTFEAQINAAVYSRDDLESSVALVSISGNDYDHFYQTPQHSRSDVWGYIKNVTDRIKSGAKRIHDLGVETVVVANLSPLGCTPFVSKSHRYQRCDRGNNTAVDAHNKILKEAAEGSRGESNSSRSAAFLILDLHSAFMSLIKQEKGARKFGSILRPCCDGIKEGFGCGDVDGKGVKQYTVCRDPGEYLYWDSVHPTQAGWDAVFQQLHPWLAKHLGSR